MPTKDGPCERQGPSLRALESKDMKIESILIYLAVAFAGFAIGRVGHVLGGQLNTSHHWIYGVILMLIGMIMYLFFFEDRWSLYFIFFGLGLTISDLNDMLDLKFYGVDDVDGVDDVEVKKFWRID